MSDTAAEQDLLVAALALRLGLVDRDVLKDVLGTREKRPDSTLEVLLRERSGKAAMEFETLRHQIEVHLRGDRTETLAGADLAGTVRDVASLPLDPFSRNRLARALPAAELETIAALPDDEAAYPESLLPSVSCEATLAPSLPATEACTNGHQPSQPLESTIAGDATVPPLASTIAGSVLDDEPAATQMATLQSNVTLNSTEVATRDAVATQNGAARPTLASTLAEIPPTAMPGVTLDATEDYETGTPTEAPSKGDRDPAPMSYRGGTPATRFQILQKHAQGGLGEIFRALDVEVNREVALKEIRSRFAGHPMSQAQFRFEAEVTGGLEHPGIVPVYALGHYQDGRPFYAMRFIRGETLQKVIDRFYEESPKLDAGERELQFRQLLRRFVDVCQAIEYAHSRAVLHRDIKPVNIMIGPYGETLVVDWGLAKPLDLTENGGPAATTQGLSTPNVAGLSRSGSGAFPSLSERPLRPTSGIRVLAATHGTAVGTPGYMSPEQIEGDSPDVGPATDIYGLGVTLYIILTGQRPFPDKHVPTILDRARRGEIVPLRQARPGVPKALEAVCLKAMALKPADRYVSARALAVDVERWLADEPVSVHQETPLAVAARWARRHRTFSASALVLLLTGLGALGIGTWLISLEQKRTYSNYLIARKAVEEMLDQVGVVSLADVPQMEDVRRQLLNKAGAFYQDFLKQRKNDRALDAEAVKAQVRLGDIEALLGDLRQAEPRYREAARRSRLLADRPGASLDARRARGSALHGLGLVLKKTGALDEARDTLKQALAVREAIVKDPAATDDDRKALAEIRFHYAALLAREGIRQSAVIQQSYREAVSTLETLAAKQTPEAATVLARALNNYGKFLWRTGKDVKTEAFFRKAIADLQVRLKATPGSSADRWQLARLNSNLGVLLSDPSRWAGDNTRQKADLAEAETAEKNGVSDLERLTGDFPRIPDYRREQASALQNLGELLRQRGQVREAETAFTKARDLFQALSREPSPTIDDSLGLAGSSLSLGGAMLDQNRDLDRAEGLFREADATLSGLMARLPNVAEYGLNLGSVRANHALLLLKKGLPNDALKVLGGAVELHNKALKALPDSPQVSRELARDHFLQCLAFKSVGDHARLAIAADDLAGVKPEDAIRHLRAAAMFAQAVPLVSANASAGEPPRRDREEAYARSALTHLRKALNLDSKMIDPKLLDSGDFAPLKGCDEFERLKNELTGQAKPQPR